jgi:hypothetical protein
VLPALVARLAAAPPLLPPSLRRRRCDSWSTPAVRGADRASGLSAADPLRSKIIAPLVPTLIAVPRPERRATSRSR